MQPECRYYKINVVSSLTPGELCIFECHIMNYR